MRRRIKLGIRCVLLGIGCSIFLFLLYAAKWFQLEWDKIDFATVVYQLSTPLKGTNSEIIEDFCRFVLPSTVILTLVIVIFYFLFEKVFSVMYFQIEVKVFDKKCIFRTGKKFYIVGKAVFWAALVCVIGVKVAGKVNELGIAEYLADISQSSTVFEEYYVSPKDVSVTFPEKKRNLIFIYLESMESTYASVEEGGGKPQNYIPELTDLAKENISISNGDKIGGIRSCTLTGWTMGALLGSTSGVPYKIPGGGNESERYSEFLPGIITLGDILQHEGYENYFLCGSDAGFAGRDIYFQKHGNYAIHDYYWAAENELIPEGYSTAWGFEDAYLFEIAKQELTQIAQSDRPFNYTMLTVDTHTPEGYICELCEDKYELPYANAIACSSRQTAQFVHWIQQQEWYENTTVVLLGDHTSMVSYFWDDIGDFQRRMYNCFVNLPESVDVQNIKFRNVTTIDLFPTTLAALGADIEGNRLGLGTNAFSEKKTLIEELGGDLFRSELKKYSKYYNDVFVKGKER